MLPAGRFTQTQVEQVEFGLLKKKKLKKSLYNRIVPMGFRAWETRVAFPGKSQLRQSLVFFPLSLCCALQDGFWQT